MSGPPGVTAMQAMTNQITDHGNGPIRVLLVDDSPVALAVLKKMLAIAPDIEVVGTAAHGVEALELIPRLHPDVICTDLHMPVMDGLELTKAVMARFPRPILVLSVSVQQDQTINIFRLLEAGAIDVMAKPPGGLNAVAAGDAQALASKIRVLSGILVLGRRKPIRGVAQPPMGAVQAASPMLRPRIVGIGASTGGPQAFQEILGGLSPDFAVPLLCIQHMSEGFMQGLVEWLAGQCRITIRLAEPGIVPRPGTAYFPRDGTHLTINDKGELECVDTPAVGGHRPSITVTFESLAQHYGNTAVGVLLTGMGRDGVEGLQAIARAGGETIAQDEESSIVFGMPKEAVTSHAARRVLPLHRIAPELATLVGEPHR